MSVEELAAISRYYGANPDFVIAGGGNTSFKDEKTLFIKGSGMALKDSGPQDFVRMDRRALARIWTKTCSSQQDAREREVLEALMAARAAGEEKKRPSVETLLHDILPFQWVVHTHPARVNGLTCSRDGEQAARDLFGDAALWIPSTNPGYILSRTVKDALDARSGNPPGVIFLQNHGVFAASDSVDGIKAQYERIIEKITRAGAQAAEPALGDSVSEWGFSAALIPALSAKAGGAACFVRNQEIAALVRDRASFYPVSSAFTPDHIVYAGSDPLFVETGLDTPETVIAAIESRWNKAPVPPKIVAVQGMGVFGVGVSEKACGLARELFIDALKVAAYTKAFGGPRFMPQDQIDFINNWEVERYRTGVSTR
ncbi:MAG: class II aldolase/adducin family protein [Spirochaetaceae bacterium]|nr:class II aldolase/adducin family protein [Spirochaetaceae bacterium]